jgi:hypothetical protein
MDSFYEEPISELEPARGGYLRHKKTKRLWHRIVCEKYHGGFPSIWVVHHLDGVKSNNHPDNLIALPKAVHDNLHRMHELNYLPPRSVVESYLDCYLKNLKRKDREKLRKLREKADIIVKKKKAAKPTLKKEERKRLLKERGISRKNFKNNYPHDASNEFLKNNLANENKIY